MKAIIDRENCIGCGLCAATCPQVFRIADDGLAEVFTNPVPQKAVECANEAVAGCPVSVISIET